MAEMLGMSGVQSSPCVAFASGYAAIAGYSYDSDAIHSFQIERDTRPVSARISPKKRPHLVGAQT